MPTIRKEVDLAANELKEDSIAGSPFEFIGGRGARVSLYAVCAPVNSAQVTFSLGSEIIGEDLDVDVEPLAGRGPIVPDDLLAADVGVPGDRIGLKIRELAGAVATVRFRLEIEEP